jgi:hypothetical protein
MTPNGAILFLLVLVALTIVAPARGLVVLAVLVASFAALELRRTATLALRRAVLVVAPLAVFLILVWVVLVGRSPAEIAAGAPGTREAALAYVSLICARLFLVVFALQAMILRFRDMTTFAFVRELYAPPDVKRLLVLTVSLVETLRHAVDRAHTALIASGTLTRRVSLRNLVNGWVLVQTVWLTAVTVVLGRLRDKWPVENTLQHLDGALKGDGSVDLFAGDDRIWLPILVGAAIVIIGAG